MDKEEKSSVMVASEQLDMPVRQLVIHERLGMDVWKASAPGVLLTRQEDIKEGDQIVTHGLLGEEIHMTVLQGDEGQLYGKCRGMHVQLAFALDDRRAWVATGFINLRALRKLHKTTVLE